VSSVLLLDQSSIEIAFWAMAEIIHSADCEYEDKLLE
jgi:hypothetical protein